MRVRWTGPSDGATVTGYIVHYTDSHGSDKTDPLPSSTTTTDITGLITGETYNISVEATGNMFSGFSQTKKITLSE